MTIYDVHFGKIGRGSFVPPIHQQFKVRDADELAVKIDNFSHRYLASKDTDVEIYANGSGSIYAGGRQVGMFTWKVSA